MLRWYREVAAAAGFSQKSSNLLSVSVLGLTLFIGGLVFEISGVLAFAVSVSVIFLAFMFEWLTLRARARRRAVSNAWPEVLDALVSASSSGISMFEAFLDLATTAPLLLRPHFKQLERDLESGLDLNSALVCLRDSMADVNVDRLVELVRIVSAAGGQGFHLALRNQSILVRQDLALAGELESKQGWVAGTAKVAITAPWLVVLMLCTRHENVAAYSSPQGAAILLVGLFVSIFAYRLIQLFGSQSDQIRVFSR